MKKKGNSVLDDQGLTGWSFGLVALVFSILLPVAGLILSVVGLIVNRKERKYAVNMFTKTGRTLNIIALIISVVLFIASIWAVAYLGDIAGTVGGL